MASTQDVQVALRERIARGIYDRGTRLPSVRALAEDLGASPSTVSRALQELEQDGWVHVTQRRGTLVSRRIRYDDPGTSAFEGELREFVRRWRLGGGDQPTLERLIAQTVFEAYAQEVVVFFLECNPTDLAQMAAQVQEESPIPVARLLLADARAHPERLRGAVLITPFFHLAEVRDFAPHDAHVLPLNFVPAEAILRTLAELPADASVGLIGADERSARRLHGLVDQFSIAHVEVTSIADDTAVERILRTSDLVVTAAAAGLTDAQRGLARRVVTVNFVLEPNSPFLARLGDERTRISHGELAGARQ